jgi:hypothetical protein
VLIKIVYFFREAPNPIVGKKFLWRANKKKFGFVYFHHNLLRFLFDKQPLKYYNVGYISMCIFCAIINSQKFFLAIEQKEVVILKRASWNSKVGFLLAAIGSAVGLGNIWRFPYTAVENGGGAFLVPYFFAIITAGIPILILEYTIGKTYRGGAPVALARLNKKFEWLGWFQGYGSLYDYRLLCSGHCLGCQLYRLCRYPGMGRRSFRFFLEYLGISSSALAWVEFRGT